MIKNSKNYLVNTITDYYFDLPYSDHYSEDIYFTIIVTSIVLFICVFLYIKSFIESYRSQWYKYKCHPLLIPFASVVNPQGSKSADMDYTYNNFTECLDQFLEELMYHVKQPLKVTIDQFVFTIQQIFVHLRIILQMIISAIVTVFDLLRNLLDRLGLFVSEIGILSSNILAFFGKIVSMITNIFYSLITVIKMLTLFFTIFAAALYMVTIVPTIVVVSISSTIFGVCLMGSLIFPPFTTPMLLVGIPSFVIMVVSSLLLVIFQFIHSVVDEFAEDVQRASAKTQVPVDDSSLTPTEYYAQNMGYSVDQLHSMSNAVYSEKVEAFVQQKAAEFKRDNVTEKPIDMPLLVWFKIESRMRYPPN